MRNKLVYHSNPIFRSDDIHSSLVIAEIGVNHEGSIEKAFGLIKLAKECGFDAVKFQHIVPSKVWHENCAPGYKLSEKESLPTDWLPLLREFSHTHEILIGCTPTFQSSSEAIKNAGHDYIKIASPQSKYDWFILDESLETGLPLVVSNGHSNLDASIKLIEYIAKSAKNEVAFLYCISAYPSDEYIMDENELIVLSELCNKYSIFFGLSDHNQSMYQSLYIKHKYNGTVFEKHFSHQCTSSLDRDVSIYPWQAKEYVRQL